MLERLTGPFMDLIFHQISLTEWPLILAQLMGMVLFGLELNGLAWGQRGR